MVKAALGSTGRAGSASRASRALVGRLLLGRPWLVVLCVGFAVLEAALLSGLGPRSASALAPQASALAPFGVFCDLRWLIVYHHSWAGFAGEAVGLLIGRSLLTAATVGAAWPEGWPRPSPGRLVARSVVFTGLAAVVLVPCTILLFGLAVVSVSWLFFAGVPSALIIGMIVHPGAVSSGWWRRPPAPRAMAWVLLTFLVLSVSAGLISVAPLGAAVPLAALAGWFNAWAWRGAVSALVCREDRGLFRPVVPVALTVFYVLGFAGAALTFSAAGRVRRPPPASAATSGTGHAAGGGLLVATGFGNNWDGGGPPVVPGPYLERRFSYAGMGPGGRPLPYRSADTNRSVVQLDRLMAAQVKALAARAGGPISIAAESEGALVAKTYLAATPQAPVKALVMLSPLVQPARVYYPPAGTPGWGVAGGLGLADLSSAIQGMTAITLSPSTPFMRSLVSNASSLQSVLSCPLPGVRQFAILPLADATAAPGPFPASIPTIVVPAFHGGLLGDGADARLVSRLLVGHPPPTSNVWSIAEEVIRPVSSAWQVPALAPDEDPTSALVSASSAAPALPPDCDQISHILQAQIAAAGPMARG